MNFIGQGFQKLDDDRHTDRHTDRRDRTHYQAAFAGSKSNIIFLNYEKYEKYRK